MIGRGSLVVLLISWYGGFFFFNFFYGAGGGGEWVEGIQASMVFQFQSIYSSHLVRQLESWIVGERRDEQ